MKKIGILLSGRGSNFEAIAENVAARRLEAEIAIVISNRPEASGLAIARHLGLTAVAIPSKGMDREVHDRCVVAELQKAGVEIVCLAGYMRLIGPSFFEAYKDRILNIHPSLLPAFPGVDAQRQALGHGVKISGCTAHFVDEGLDSGPIIMQAAVPVFDDDTVASLSERILKEEHRIYSDALRIVLAGAYRIENRRVIIHISLP